MLENTFSPTHQIIIKLYELENPNLDDLLEIRKAVSGKAGLAHMPGNADILKTYFQLVAQEKIIRNKQIELTLRKRAIRSQSGIVPVQVLTKPFWCP